MNTLPRPLILAEQIIESTGLKMTFQYDDLVFVDNNPFLLRFNDDKYECIFIHFNKDCETNAKNDLLHKTKNEGLKIGIYIILDTDYVMSQKENSEEINITFQS